MAFPSERISETICNATFIFPTRWQLKATRKEAVWNSGVL